MSVWPSLYLFEGIMVFLSPSITVPKYIKNGALYTDRGFTSLLGRMVHYARGLEMKIKRNYYDVIPSVRSDMSATTYTEQVDTWYMNKIRDASRARL